MKWMILVFILIIKTALCVEITAERDEESSEEILREIREFDREGWRAIKSSEGNNEWVPQDNTQEIKLVRRRLRKRKKRPPFSPDDSTNDGIAYARPLRRRIRPHRIHEKQSPWDDIEEEDARPYTRRRIPPKLPTEETVEISGEIKTEMKTVNEEPVKPIQDEKPHNPISDLKSILKQTSGTLSLSEILQQKNLSLTELLSGNERAISALTEKPLETTEKMIKTKAVEVKSNDAETAGFDKPTEENVEIGDNSSATKKNLVDVNRKRLVTKRPIEQSIKEQTFEMTTDRRIFVPSHPKYYTSLSFKPDFVSYLDYSPDKTTSTTEKSLQDKIVYNTIASTKAGKLPTTNAKLKQNLTDNGKSKKQNVAEIPKPIKINLSEVIGFQLVELSKTTTTDSTTDNDKPLRIPIDLGLMMENSTLENETTTTEIPLENTIYVTAREEIMEVLKDPSSREKLSRILEMRNMTIEELVQQRERGSSQVHLADIFHNKSKEPEPKEEVFVGQVEAGPIVSSSERQQKSRNFDTINIIKNGTAIQEVIGNKLDIHPTVQDIQTERTESQTQSVVQSPDILSLDSLGDPLFSRSSNEKFNVDEGDDTEDEAFLKLPSGVRSAIFVSLAIIGLSILVFLTILVIFKWTQLKHRRINYCHSLTSKFRSPIILQGRPTAAIKTFVNETLGRRKSYYKNNVQRMCDNIWEGDKERKLSF